MDKRREAEAAEAREKLDGELGIEKKPTSRKKSTTAKPKKPKEKPQQRKRLLWGVYNSSNKEEGRFSYDQKEAALEKAKALQEKTGKPCFVQPIKEVIGEVKAAAPATKEKPVSRKAPVEPDEDEVRDVDDEGDADAEAEADGDDEGGPEFEEEGDGDEGYESEE